MQSEALAMLLRILTVGILLPALSWAKPMSQAWIDHAPTVEQIFHDIQGSDPIDTAARQAAAFDILRFSIWTWTDELDFRRMPPRANAKFQEYSAAFGHKPYGLKFNDGFCIGEGCIRWQFYTKESRYSADIAFTREV